MAPALARGAIALALLVLGAAGCGAVVLLFPQPLFPHHVSEGRLALYADEPFDPEAGRRLLADIEARIGASPLRPGDGVHRIFVAATPWRERLTFLWSYGAGGLNYYPLTRNVFLRQSDVERGLLISPLGLPVPPPRTLAYFAAHEIAHSLTGEAVGPLAFWRMPKWLREGVADYIALPARGDYHELARAYLVKDHDLDPVRSGLYARYRLLVTFFLERKGWAFERLLASEMSQDAAERLLEQDLATR